uniref:Uncharacterized protein LOC104231827 n=1 Tax=Nicotiana sylvestris TaxID=4096 RepID=A0A1U7WX57_NICSY|nr:PREDICTED: uncharacterized protein LOC104231827 [Nicotiana sylvestris]
MALDCKCDALDLAETRGQQNQELHLAQEYIRGKILENKPTERFREYAIKWREQAARVKSPMDNHELITIFLEAQEPDYFQNMMSVMGRPFAEAIKIGEMVENGLKAGNIVRVPASRIPRPQQQNFRAPYNARPRQDYGREQRLWKNSLH